MVKSKHDLLVERVSEELRDRGYSVANETPISNGRGAVDVSCFLGEVRECGEGAIFHAEVKESPSSVSKNKVKRQLGLYKSFFGDGADYVLISPDANGQAIFQNLDGSFRGNLGRYLSFLEKVSEF